MKMELTERDKKLLIFLAAFLVVVGLGAGIILPFFNKGTELDEKIVEAEIEKNERMMKVAGLPALVTREKAQKEKIAALRESFYKSMDETEIDKLLTERALGHQLLVKDLTIGEIKEDMEVSVDLYRGEELREAIAAAVEEATSTENAEGSDGQEAEAEEAGNAAEGDTGESIPPANEGAVNLTGIKSVLVSLSLEGTRENLQAFLNGIVAAEPKERLVSFSWGENQDAGSSAYTLSVSAELYMWKETLEPTK